MENKNKKFVVAVVAVTFGAFALGWMTTTLNNRMHENDLTVLETPVLAEYGQTFVPEGYEPAAGSEQSPAAAEEAEPEADAEAVADESAPMPTDEPAAAAVETPDAETPAAESGAEAAPEAAAPAAEEIDYEKNPLTSTRSIGSPDAPVVMEEFFSLTCSHCASFHRDMMPIIKSEYVDTGKVRVVFHDFPLNPPAFQAAILARCLEPDQYYNFVSVLFETQNEWSHETSPAKLIQTAKLAGLSDEKLDMCMENKDVTKFILTNMQKLGATYDVKSTPTFVLNHGEAKIQGNRPVDQFKAELDAAVAKAAEKKAE